MTRTTATVLALGLSVCTAGSAAAQRQVPVTQDLHRLDLDR